MSRNLRWKSQEPSSCKDADQAEFNAMRSISATLDSAIADEIISGEIDDEIDELALNGPRWQGQDLAQEDLLDSVHAEVMRRIRLLGPLYPFELIENRLVYRKSNSGFYEFCLTVTQAPSVVEGTFVKLPRYFERTVTALVRSYFGKGAKGLHTGHPRSPSTSFRNVMAKLERHPFEWVWNPQDQLADGDVKDETLDFVITVTPLDDRAGNLYVLGQCACGNNWNTKLGDPHIGKIKRWFSPPWSIPPLRAFTTPFVIGDQSMRDVVNDSQAMVFDRPRLVKIAETMLTTRAQRAIRRYVTPLEKMV